MPNPRCVVQLLTLALLICNPGLLVATEGDPVAVRNWPGGVVSVESHWGLNVVIDPDGIGHLELQADRLVSPSEDLDHYLSRLPNESAVTWQSAADTSTTDDNAIRVQTVRYFGNEPNLQIDVDGIRVVYVPAKWFEIHRSQDTFTVNLQELTHLDVLVLDTDDLDDLTSQGVASLLRHAKPKAVLLNRINASDQAQVAAITNQFGSALVVDDQHNTVALSSEAKDQPVRILVTADNPWEMPEPVATLFAAMETANADSQAVFAKLSANQMNFKPANGTHTPRWNTEHMMGRQLLFFSQIYHAQNPVIPIMDLNPEQMPPDYVFAHPDWDGREEARQMHRVSEFTRRFAYLLDGVDLDEKAPGSRWTLRGLLKQMQRHYGEHTANTVKKFDLPGWPNQ